MVSRNDKIFTGPVDANGLPITYVANWQDFSNLSDAQKAWFRSQPQWLVFYAGFKRWEKEQVNGITVNGIPVDTNAQNYGLLTGLGFGASLDRVNNPNTTYTFTVRGQNYTLTPTQALGLFEAVHSFVQACRNCEGAMVTGINVKTITSEAQIDTALAAIPTSY